MSPFGDLIRTEARGTLFGNRGCLHDPEGNIVRFANGRRWISCLLSFKNRARSPLMQPGRYTELFFLDEATALAAGHRPCAECRRPDYNRFRSAWAAGRGDAALPSADELDAVLDTERRRRPYDRCPVDRLPDGAMVALGGEAHLVRRGLLLPWSPACYAEPAAPPTSAVEVITPASIVAAITAGYGPTGLG